jgi:hypothetical protein
MIIPEKNQYDYQLYGFDKKVVHNGTNRVFSYTMSPSGNYTLEVRVSNNDVYGIRQDLNWSLSLSLHSGTTWWFKTIAAIVVVRFLYFYSSGFVKTGSGKRRPARQRSINR